jgi:PAS domain S-box-containing protein
MMNALQCMQGMAGVVIADLCAIQFPAIGYDYYRISEDVMKTRPFLGEKHSTEARGQLHAEQVKQLYQNASVGLAATVVNSAILSSVQWKVVPHQALVLWLACIFLITLLRYALLHRYRRSSVSPAEAGRWGTWFTVGAALSGIAWGAAGIVLFSAESTAHQVFLAFVLGGMVAGAAVTYSIIMQAFLAYSIPALTPLIIRFFTISDEIHIAMGGMTLYFAVLIYGVAVRVHATALQSLRLRFENSSLISYLTAAKERAEKLNEGLLSEIAERKKAEESLRLSEQRFRQAVDNFPGVFAIYDAQRRYQFVNARATRVGGYAPQDVLGRTDEELWPPEVTDGYLPILRNAATTRTLQSGEFTVDLSSSGTHTMAVWYIPLLDERKEIRQILGITEDITERREYEDRLLASNSLLKLLSTVQSRKEYLDAIVPLLCAWSGCRCVGIRVVDEHGGIPFESYAGFSREFWESETRRSLTDRPCVCARIIQGKPEPKDAEAMTGFGSFCCENTARFVAGLMEQEQTKFLGMCVRNGFLSVAVVPVRYNGKTIAAVHLADERAGRISRKRVEFIEALTPLMGEAIQKCTAEAERARLAAAVEATVDAIVITDARGAIEYVNSAFERTTGYARDEVMRRDIHILDSGKHDQEFFQELRENLARNGVWRGRLIHKKKDGSLYFADCTCSAVRGASGEIMNYVSIKRDVTERLKLESIAESVNTMENIGYIFSGVRHEIGNPINTAKMILSVLRHKLEQSSPETIRDYIDRTLGEIGRVEYHLKTLKNFNLYETLELTNLNMAVFMDRFMSLVSHDLEQKGISIKTMVQPVAEWAYTDPRALQQALLNIVTNAADALEGRRDPTIAIEVSKRDEQILIQIHDNGSGIPEEEQKTLFRPFVTSKKHGTGLGLVLVKRMLTKMNGGIAITSHPGVGTTVDILIPEGRNDAHEQENTPDH